MGVFDVGISASDLKRWSFSKTVPLFLLAKNNCRLMLLVVLVEMPFLIRSLYILVLYRCQSSPYSFKKYLRSLETMLRFHDNHNILQSSVLIDIEALDEWACSRPVVFRSPITATCRSGR